MSDLLCAFVNTRTISVRAPEGRDRLATVRDLDAWWAERGGGGPRGTEADLALAHTVREGLRAQFAAHNAADVDGDADALRRLERALADLPLRATTGPDVLVAAAKGHPALAAVLTAAVRARMDGDWERHKVCRDPLCREAYRDTSRNRSRTWCSMSVCGSRSKQRAFARRQREA